MDNQSILEMLNQCTEATEAMRSMASDGEPPTAVSAAARINSVEPFVYQKDGATKAKVTIKYQFLDGEFAGNNYSLNLFLSAKPALETLFGLAGLLGFDPGQYADGTLKECVAYTQKYAVGRDYNLAVSKSPNKKLPGTFYTNYKFLSVLTGAQ